MAGFNRNHRLQSSEYALHALTPLFWGHMNPYGRFDLDMRTRLDFN
ncbi:hypothetical protein HN018_27885 (plasmid) [Lichenicola cladoniae]|uniref:Tn3 transposase DDE domain-containing protein n=1 Tax=Lichenicola cladoniae TaxID=1484109 RepID=A0A6M8I0C3_9PROT|nr:hypothetical protein [Lichenicola cladoniae]NPD69679.1 hypothetical protein [Acetobacteraceae bacterium]QKE93948.1 hypothetical protein HN018_27885 [Lichenicola cladoniae]